jgi:eukaryotic-like serine/threonine-protein kinase
MTPGLRARAESIFDAALELPLADRREFVARECGSDGVLHAQVSALLSAHERAGGILEAEAADLLPTERRPERLGAYRVVREIGRGGMGVVYQAERDDGQFSRRVAIKVLRAADDHGLHQRVLAERQILAALDHPHIARLLDGGIDGDGRPYLVMEHVDGLPIDVYCERMRLTVAERLRLFAVVARAVAYAHRNLIVHRDLKPSNILVTADGTPKLLDFGIARLLNPGLGGVAAQTLQGGLEFTPEYASPEQLRGEPLSTQSDIYSLGVLLYELLTGRRPFSGRNLAELIPRVCDDDAERPSERVQRDEEIALHDGHARSIRAEGVARAMHATPQRLGRMLRGDLDAIVATTLRKERRNRYASADLLVEDVERYLEARPVLARPAGVGYTLLKMVRRHRISALSLAGALAALMAGTGAALWQAQVAREERDRAALAHAEAERVAEFVLGLFESAAPEAGNGGEITARDLVQRGVRRIDALQDRPAVQASLLAVLGRVLESMADYEPAQQLTERALALLEAEGDGLGVARLHYQRGGILRRRGEYAAAEQAFLRARDLQVRLLGAGHPDLGPTYHDLARMSVYLGDMQEAQRRADEAYEIQRTSLGETHPATLQSRLLAGVIQRRRGMVDDAERTIRAVIALRPQAVGSTRTAAMQDRLQLADLLLLTDRDLGEAERIYQDIIASTQPGNPDDYFARFWAKGSLVSALARRGEFDVALAIAEELRAERLAIYGPDHPASSPDLIANLLVEAGRLDEAERLHRATVEGYRARLGERHPIYLGAVANQTAVHIGRGEYATADSILLRLLAVQQELGGSDSPAIPDLLWRRARAQAGLGNHDAAEALLRDALERATRKQLGGVSRTIHETYVDLYREWGRPADAERHDRLARSY